MIVGQVVVFFAGTMGRSMKGSLKMIRELALGFTTI